MFFECTQEEGNQMQLYALFETQKKICSQYIKIAAQQLYSQEAETISSANQLLERIATKNNVKDLSEWDVWSTRDTLVLEDDSSFNISSLSTQSKGRHIQRKSVRPPRPTRQLEGSLFECLQQIQENCTPRTYSIIQKVADEYRKLKLKVFQCQKKQKNMGVREKLIQELQQKNALLTQRMEDEQQTVKKMKADYSALKNANSQLQDMLYQKKSEINSSKKIKLLEEIRAHHYSSSIPQPCELLTAVLSEKEQVIGMRLEAVRQVEQKIQKELFSPQNGCLKCCQTLRKMKSSILTYKGYLQREGEQFEKLVDNFKVSLLECQS